MSFGTEIKVARVMKKISQKELATELSISPQYLCDIENDKKLPSYPLARKLQQMFPNAKILKQYNTLI